MKKERFVSILILILSMGICFTSCSAGKNTADTSDTSSTDPTDSTGTAESGSDTSLTDTASASEIADSETTITETTVSETTVPDTTIPDTTVPETTVVFPGGGTILTPGDLKLDPVFFTCALGGIVEVSENDGKYTINAKKTGTDRITFFNNYGETAVADVTVTTGKIDCVVTPFTAHGISFNVLDCGAKANNSFDCTKAIQNCIDKASEAGGGTVYLPAGIYRISTLSMKPNVSLRLEGFLPDATVGYNQDTKSYVNGGKIAILRSTGSSVNSFFFLNVVPKSYCTNGTSHFLISGGMIDCSGKMKTAGFACGEDITFENCIIKDNPNNHAFQIEGCSDVIIRNVMFAGYNYPSTNGVLTRETIQLEPTTSGAIGSNTATNPIQCTEGDYHHTRNVSVIGCYFGPSDNYGSHLTAVGHHSAGGALSCDGFVFSGNVVDNPLYCGLHLLNTLNVTISGNTFISTRKATSASLGDDSALLSVYGKNSSCSYTDASGKKIVYCYANEMPGSHHYNIENNTFTLGGGTFLRAVYIAGIKTEYNLSALYKSSSSEYRVTEFGGEAKAMNGYIVQTNTAYDIRLTGNKFNIKSAITQTDCFAYFNNVRGLTLKDNTASIAGSANFSRKYDGMTGFFAGSVSVGDEMFKRSIFFSSTAKTKVTAVCGDEEIVLPNPPSNITVNFKTKGNGALELENDARGNLTLTITPDEGYAFSGWVTNDGTPIDISKQLTAGMTIYAEFTAKK
ncbi:MAG: hypothetical protein MJ102_01400 [Clostridia bacterium]|nr:hypothetical protein [Clostridia bacterium]